jgi:uncharacterized Rmd1/YagE family protein
MILKMKNLLLAKDVTIGFRVEGRPISVWQEPKFKHNLHELHVSNIVFVYGIIVAFNLRCRSQKSVVHDKTTLYE